MNTFKSPNSEISSTQIGTCFCIGSNYSDHIKEMGSLLDNKPVLFLKPSSSVITANKVKLPDYSNNIHHEAEIICVISKDCYQVNANEAQEYISGIGIGLDLTLRDLQKAAKEKGQPWAVAKGFYGSGPISEILPLTHFPNLNDINFSLKINNEIRQEGSTSQMLMAIPEIIEYISSIFYLQKGDIIFTGTPAGVGKINTGDIAELSIDNLINYKITFE